MNYASIRTCDIANGEGVRVSLFVSGCRHHCPGCFNEEAQAFDYGKEFTRAVEDEILAALEPDFIAGLTLLGGEPMEPENQRALLPFLRRFREKFGAKKTLWVYTGCILEKLSNYRIGELSNCGEENSKIRKFENSKIAYPWRCEVTDEFLGLTDVLVDGPFIESEKNISLRFRGSENQRILELAGLRGGDGRD